MKKPTLDHIGIAVRSIESAAIYQALGLTVDDVETVESQRVRTAFLAVGDANLELLEPTSPDSAVAKFIEKRGEGIHHICLRVDDIEATRGTEEPRDRGTEAMIEGFEEGALVIINLVNPKEKFWGVLGSLSAAGLTLKGINLDSFDDWVPQVTRDDDDMSFDLVTMFVPLFRVERIFLDEAVAGRASVSFVESWYDDAGMR